MQHNPAARPLESSSVQALAARPDASVWLMASAGTGKTKVLTDRVLSLLLAGVPQGEILGLTFTKAAAEEMQQRIIAQAERWLLAPSDTLFAELTALCGTPPENLDTARRLYFDVVEAEHPLRIQTIHAFCQDMLGAFTLEAGLAPGFRVLEEGRAAQALNDAVRAALADTGGQAALEILSQHGTQSWVEGLLTEWLLAMPPIPDAAAMAARLGLSGIDDTLSPEHAAQLLNKQENPVFGDLPAIRAVLPDLKITETEETEFRQPLYAFLADPESMLRQPDDYALVFLTQKNTIRKKKFIINTPALLVEATRLEAHYKKLEALRCLSASLALGEMGQRARQYYSRIKQQHNALDYNDLLLLTLQLLTDVDASAWVRYKMDQRISHVLLDEAQDTSPLQWQLLNALTAEYFAGIGRDDRILPPTVFVVGDKKQSIYRFQGADVALFSAQQALWQDNAASAGFELRNLEQQRSYRSTAEVLSFVDSVFNTTSARSGVLDAEILQHGVTRREAGSVTLWPMTERPEDEQESWALPITAPQTSSAVAAHTRFLAGNVRTLIENGTPPGDILILLARRAPLQQPLLAALRAEGVPVAGVDRVRVGGHLLTLDMLSLLRFCAIPEDDFNLAGLLRSPLCGLSEAALLELCAERGESSVWARLHDIQPDLAEQLTAYRTLQRQGGVTALWNHIVYAAGGYAAFAGCYGGEADTVLDALEAALTEADATLEAAITALESLRGSIKRDIAPDTNAVRVVTIHGAKGLEAPVVILADACQRPAPQDSLLRDPLSGQLFWCPGGGVPEALAPLREADKTAEIEEYNRLLYVALTRARDHLYVAGLEPKKKSKQVSWYDMLAAVRQGGTRQ